MQRCAPARRYDLPIRFRVPRKWAARQASHWRRGFRLCPLKRIAKHRAVRKGRWVRSVEKILFAVENCEGVGAPDADHFRHRSFPGALAKRRDTTRHRRYGRLAGKGAPVIEVHLRLAAGRPSNVGGKRGQIHLAQDNCWQRVWKVPAPSPLNPHKHALRASGGDPSKGPEFKVSPQPRRRKHSSHCLPPPSGLMR